MNSLTSLARRRLLSQSMQRDLFPKRDKQKRPDLSHPAFWYEDHPIALIGRRQSPINIVQEKCILNSKHLVLSPKLELSYPSTFGDLRLRNPKDNSYFGWRVDVPYDYGDQTVLQGGPLNHRYKLIQFHGHWGKKCACGSEHIINGKHYSAELHFVHWNSDLYYSARQAAISKDGLAVVAVFLEVVPDDQYTPLSTLETICSLMSKIKYKGSMQPIDKRLNLLELIPNNRSYWTYLGSLTTPPLWETVTWIIFEQPIRCSQRVLDTFRQLLYYPHTEIKDFEDHFDMNVEENYRPVQPLNGRKVIYVKQ